MFGSFKGFVKGTNVLNSDLSEIQKKILNNEVIHRFIDEEKCTCAQVLELTENFDSSQLEALEKVLKHRAIIRFLENGRLDVQKLLGLSYEQLETLNNELVYHLIKANKLDLQVALNLDPQKLRILTNVIILTGGSIIDQLLTSMKSLDSSRIETIDKLLSNEKIKSRIEKGCLNIEQMFSLDDVKFQDLVQTLKDKIYDDMYNFFPGLTTTSPSLEVTDDFCPVLPTS